MKNKKSNCIDLIFRDANSKAKGVIKRIRNVMNKKGCKSISRGRKDLSEQKEIMLKSIAASYKQAEKEECPCALCGEVSSEVLAREDRHGLGIETCICLNCGLIRSNPIPCKRWLKNFYKEWYYTLYFGKSLSTNNLTNLPWNQQATRLVSSFRQYWKRDPSSVLEIGCGVGSTLMEIKKQVENVEVIGIEPNKVAAEQARVFLGKKNVIYRGFSSKNVKKILRQASHFDLIYSTHVLEHVKDPNTFLKLVRKLADYDTLIYIETPDAFYKGWKFPHMFHIGHLRLFSEVTLRRILKKNGLDPFAVIRGEQKCMKRSGVGLFSRICEEDSGCDSFSDFELMRNSRKHISGFIGQ